MEKNKQKISYKTIAEHLRLAREEAGLKQEEVAKKLGKYQSYLSKIENGERRVDIIELLELAQIYDKAITFFIKPLD